MARIAVAALCLAALTAADDGWEDTPALTNCWQAMSSGDTDKLIDVFVQGGREVAFSRSADGRGPLYWAYEFKMVDALALLMELESDEEAEDIEGKHPRDFFPEGQAELDEFTADAGAKVQEMMKLLKKREEEFSEYQRATHTYEKDLDEADEETIEAKAEGIDEIDYADEDEDEVVGGKDEV